MILPKMALILLHIFLKIINNAPKVGEEKNVQQILTLQFVNLWCSKVQIFVYSTQWTKCLKHFSALEHLKNSSDGLIFDNFLYSNYKVDW